MNNNNEPEPANEPLETPLFILNFNVDFEEVH